MKILNLVLVVLLLMINVADAKNLSEVDGELANMIGDNPDQVPGIGVIAFKDGKKIYSYFAGKRNIDKNLGINEKTRFRAASVSKMFTMFGIMKLVEQGKINLDEDASKYLGFKLRNPNFPDMPITVRMLASHTSTLRDGENYVLPPNFSLEEFFKSDGVAYEDGKHFADKDKNYFTYCNLNYCVLGTIIEKVSGERFDLFQKKNIFRPLNIKADYIVGNLSANEFKNLGALYLKKNSAGEWNENGEWIAQVDNFATQPKKDVFIDEKTLKEYDLKNYKIGSNATCFEPQGGLRISFEELGNTLEMLMNGGKFHGKQIIRADLIEEMCKPQWIYDGDNGNTYEVMFSYGLGLYQIDGAGKARLCETKDIDLIGHSGDAYGMIAGLYFIPNTKDGVIFMINGTAVEAGVNEKSFGKFGNGYIWEENIMNPVCKKYF